MVKVIFHTTRNCSERKEFAPSVSILSFKRVPSLKTDTLKRITAVSGSLPFMCIPFIEDLLQNYWLPFIYFRYIN